MTERIFTQVQAPKMGFLQRVHSVTKGRTEARLRPGQETNLAPPYLNLRYFGSKCIALKKKLTTLLRLFGAPQWFGAGALSPLITPLVWHFPTKRAAVKFAEPECRTTSPNWENTTEVSWAMYPERPTKDWWDKLFWLNPRESDPDVVQGLGGVTASPTLLCPVLVWSQQNYLKLLLTVRYSKFSYGCCPRNPP